jgi:histidinol phosphatase-like enzyme (inositol monophosphatase family)
VDGEAKRKHENPVSTTLTDPDIRRYLTAIEAMADAAARVTLSHFRSQVAVDDKNSGGKFDPVTLADRDAEAAIRQLIAEKFPDDGIIGEEHGQQMGENNWVNRNYWVIDPIDGTRSFISGIPLWGTLIAVNDGARPVIGVIDHPAVGERFIGSPSGAFMNGKPLKVRTCDDLSNATLSTTDPDLLGAGAEREAFFEVAKHVRLKRYGYDCYAYAMVAAGHMDLVIEAGLQIYDVQALIPVIEAAGGIITDWQGGSPAQGGRVVAAGDARIHAAALEILSKVK